MDKLARYSLPRFIVEFQEAEAVWEVYAAY